DRGIAGHRAGRPADHRTGSSPERTTDHGTRGATDNATGDGAAGLVPRVLVLGPELLIVVVAEAGAPTTVVPTPPDVVPVGVVVAGAAAARPLLAERRLSRVEVGGGAGLAGPAVRLVAVAMGRLDVRPRSAGAVALLVRGAEARRGLVPGRVCG